ncbi:MICOS complex subunit MIC60-like [Chenopodium quinoa]|uniref:MICOS complex subunit MIC60-like n=1 Tax=Chenopodium quinoa TaxID=63459 RepID=UPI000B777003|nr:MICOS complex subunit MIC60-like [Chenopodium quinoa]
MLRRSALALSRRRSLIGRASRQSSTPQIYLSVYPRREFSSIPQQNASPGPSSKTKPIGLFIGSVAFGACFYAAYSRGYINVLLGQKEQSSDPLKVGNRKSPKGDEGLDFQNNKDSTPVHTSKDSETLNHHVNDETERQSAMDPVGDSGKYEGENDSIDKDSSELTNEAFTHAKEEDLLKHSGDVIAKGEQLSKSSLEETAKDEYSSSQKPFADNADMKSSGEKSHFEQHETDVDRPTITDVGAVLQGNNTDKDDITELKPQNEPKVKEESSASLLDTYHLEDKVDDGASTTSGHTSNNSSPWEETSSSALGDSADAYVSKDGKLILDFLQAIHAAEQRQAELDARVFAEEKRAMKDKYEKELKDARARELMYAEEAAMLEKEVNKEKAKAAAALKSLQERAEERLKMELEEKEREAELKQKEIKDLAKAELAASIAREKAAQIEKMAEANLNINALCMAFYAGSEEARQTHSMHKLALGALALEDALSNGLPVQSELDALHVCVDNVNKDPLLQLALSSIPEDVRLHGTDTILQLNRKFDDLKGTLRHFSLIPPDGGGILAHSLARVASFLKVKEADQSGDGIESVLNKAESLLAQGKLAEAADVLEDGVKDSKASEVVGDWLRRARNRAIADQALVLIQSYAASISLS